MMIGLFTQTNSRAISLFLTLTVLWALSGAFFFFKRSCIATFKKACLRFVWNVPFVVIV